jgi:hypothetical protein
VIPLDATLVRGSHGRRPADASDYPICITEGRWPGAESAVESTEIYRIIRGHVLEQR